MSTIGTNLILYSNLPLDRNYENTLYFSSEAAQRTFFQSTAVSLGYVNGDYSPLTFQRVNSNRIKVQISEATAEHVNYMAFRNSTFSSKWFYAFIDEVNYINDNVYEIVYTLDYIQTYLFSDCTLLESFIERQHSETDVAGDNLVPEQIQTATDVGFTYDDYFTVEGEHNPGTKGLEDKYALICFMLPSFNSMADIKFCTFAGVELASVNVYGWKDIFSSVQDSSGYTPLDNFRYFILNHQADADGIIAMYIIPQGLVGDYFVIDSENRVVEFEPVTLSHQLTKPTMLDYYTPRNKKLLTFPFSYLVVSTGETDHVYRYEYFTEAIGVFFTAYFEMSTNPQWLLSPSGYGGQAFVSGGSGAKSLNINSEHFLTFSRFPMVAFPVDTFKAWLAQTASSNLLSLASGTLTAGIAGYGAASMAIQREQYAKNPHYDLLTSPGKAGALGAAGYAFNKITSLVSTGIEKSKEADRAVGTNSGYILNELGMAGFRLIRHSLEASEAERVDNYFDLYGYAQNTLAVPNLNARPHWTYVKTAGLQVIGNCPHGAVEAVKSIFDAGIRFWNDPQEIGNYTLDNTPV